MLPRLLARRDSSRPFWVVVVVGSADSWLLLEGLWVLKEEKGGGEKRWRRQRGEGHRRGKEGQNVRCAEVIKKLSLSFRISTASL